MTQEKRFYISGSQTERPLSACTIYVDGTAGPEFREGIDLELSHWIPNRTEDQYKAGTSTEICFKYLEASPTFSYDLVINNHLDIDGLLSVFVLCYPTLALKYKDVLCNTAKTGDFWAWSEGKPLKLFQELTLLYKGLKNINDAYKESFNLIIRTLNEPETTSPAENILKNQYSLIENGKIKRQEITPHFVTYHIPKSLTHGKVQEFLKIPHFNEPISERLPFWAQVRNRLDAEKIQLIATETEIGTHFDLWYPGYAWAETKGLWQPPGLIRSDSVNNHRIQWPVLSKAIHELNKIETGTCKWKLFSSLSFSGGGNPKGFPIVATTLNEQNEAKESLLPIERVTMTFKKLFSF